MRQTRLRFLLRAKLEQAGHEFRNEEEKKRKKKEKWLELKTSCSLRHCVEAGGEGGGGRQKLRVAHDLYGEHGLLL